MTDRTVELLSVMDRENCAIMARELAEYIGLSLPLTISGSSVDQIGQSGLQLLVSIAKTAAKLEVLIKLTGLSPNLAKAIQLAGLDDALLNILPRQIIMNINDIQAIFLQECEEGLAQAEAGLLECQSGNCDSETINTIFRAVHSIKGGSGAFGYSALQSFTHHFETVLDFVRSGEIEISPEVISDLLIGFDILTDHVSAIKGEGPTPDDAAAIAMLKARADNVGVDAPAANSTLPNSAEPTDAGSEDIDDLLAALGAFASPAVAEPWFIKFRPFDAALDNGGEPLLLLRELSTLGAKVVSTDISAVAFLEDFDPNVAALTWLVEIPGDVAHETVMGLLEFISDLCTIEIIEPQVTTDVEPSLVVSEPVQASADLAETGVGEAFKAVNMVPANDPANAPAPTRASSAGGQTIRVDLEKLDRLVNLVGELVITQSMLNQRLLSRGLAAVEELNDLDQLTRELQDGAMAIRAQPVKSVFSRVPRIVRELEAATGKRINLVIEGEGTELDKTVIEKIGEPLTHLIRNAIDHGIETPAQRRAAGKPDEGRLLLSAEHRGGSILIIVQDDGAGINRERVLQSALAKGIVSPEARLSDEEIDALIFAPGFSTAQEVSNISGRGVGMDVVRQNVQALGGRISIVSAPGTGSTFTLALPLTLAILDGMIVSVGSETYVIPLTHIVESLRPAAAEMTCLGYDRWVLNVRGQVLPVLHVGATLSVSEANYDPEQAVMIVVETERSGRIVLMVDAIRDQRQVVIKSLEVHYRPVEGCAGATILGDGSVALILDVEGIASLRAAPLERLRA